MPLSLRLQGSEGPACYLTMMVLIGGVASSESMCLCTLVVVLLVHTCSKHVWISRTETVSVCRMHTSLCLQPCLCVWMYAHCLENPIMQSFRHEKACQLFALIWWVGDFGLTQLRRKMKAKVKLCTQQNHGGTVIKGREIVCSKHKQMHGDKNKTIQTGRMNPGTMWDETTCTVHSLLSRDVRSHTGHLSHCGHPAGNKVPLAVILLSSHICQQTLQPSSCFCIDMLAIGPNTLTQDVLMILKGSPEALIWKLVGLSQKFQGCYISASFWLNTDC